MSGVFETTIIKKPNSASERKWANVYHLFAPDLSAAHTFMKTTGVAFEVSMHTNDVQFVECTTRDMVPHGGTFITTPLSDVGTYTRAGDLLPLFLVVLAELVPDEGYAGKKYYHMGLGEGQQDAGLWATGVQTDLQNALDTLISDAGGLGYFFCNKTDATEYLSARVRREVLSHQFRRKWARRSTVIILPG